MNMEVTMMNEDMIGRTIEVLLSPLVDRPVDATFTKLGKDRKYSVAIQTSLYEFDESGGPKGPMYLNLNKDLLRDVDDLVQTLREITEKAKA
jgi:hypothetical protein